MKKFNTRVDFLQFCKEVSNYTGDKWQTAVFGDHTITKVTGPFEARKEVWCVLSGGEIPPKEVYEALYSSCTNDEGLSIRPYKEV